MGQATYHLRGIREQTHKVLWHLAHFLSIALLVPHHEHLLSSAASEHTTSRSPHAHLNAPELGLQFRAWSISRSSTSSWMPGGTACGGFAFSRAVRVSAATCETMHPHSWMLSR